MNLINYINGKFLLISIILVIMASKNNFPKWASVDVNIKANGYNLPLAKSMMDDPRVFLWDSHHKTQSGTVIDTLVQCGELAEIWPPNKKLWSRARLATTIKEHK